MERLLFALLFGKIIAMYDSCLEKQLKIKELFASCSSAEDKYAKIIELGRLIPHLKEEFRIEQNLVSGCQSRMYLHSSFCGGKMIFEAESDALISAGLAALLLMVYSGESPEAVIKCVPAYLDEIGISASLTPSRSNGLYSLHLRMKQEALKALILESRAGSHHLTE